MDTQTENISDAHPVTDEQLKAISEVIPQDNFTSSNFLFADLTNPA